MKFPADLSAKTQAAMREVAETYILPRYKKLAEGDVKSKSHPNDLVTIADVESEHALTRMLPDFLPGSRVVGEEAVAADAKVLDSLAGSNPVWIVDPIDGTANFVKGEASFAVMIALVQSGETLAGWIHDPVINRTLWAEKGAGAWLTVGQTTVPVKMPAPPSDNLHDLTAGIYNREFKSLVGKFHRVTRIGSAAHDYWSLSDGRMHVLCFSRMRTWDHAAGVLICAEAGGYSCMLSGKPYAPALADQVGIVSAPSRHIWEIVVNAKS